MCKSKELHLCQVLYFSCPLSSKWAEVFHNVALKYASELGQVITHFSFSPSDDNVASARGYAYIKRNEARLRETIAGGMYKGVDFYSVGADKNFFEAPLALSMVTEAPLKFPIDEQRKERDYGIVILTCSLQTLREPLTVLKFAQDFLRDITAIVEIGYGLVDTIEGRKYPGLYFSNSACSPYLTDEERRDVETWRRQGWRHKTVVRKVYWGNVLSKSHWANDPAKEKYLMTALEHECKGNVFWIDDDRVFFCAPVDILEYEQKQKKIDRFKRNVRKILVETGIEVLELKQTPS